MLYSAYQDSGVVLMKRVTLGILAHVDAGKTTLSEGLLYTCRSIRKLGRVDKKDSFLDNYTLERERGITIYSKQAVFEYGDVSFTLLDTPGHVDFSAEMERALLLLDAAVLVISGPEGIQAHTRTLWKLLKAYDVPAFIFVNKMDRGVCSEADLMKQLKGTLSENCVDIMPLVSASDTGSGDKMNVYENLALCDEEVMEGYLESGEMSDGDITDLIGERKCFPVLFGSALKLEGIAELLEAMKRFFPFAPAESEFGARIYKVGRDNAGNRLTYMKITGGEIKTREQISYVQQKSKVSDNGGAEGGQAEADMEDIDGGAELLTEKINEIRCYNGEKYESLDKAVQGQVVAVTGLSGTCAGEVLGAEDSLPEKQLTPVLTYRVVAKDYSSLMLLLPKLRLLEEEEPQLHVVWNPEMKELQVRIMGEIQLEILKSRFSERFKEEIAFDRGSILYRETVTAPVLGVGHYEPLRHYAEAQLVIEPGEPGSGICFRSACTTDELEMNWQRLIMTHVYEREHKGCLTGAVLSDVVITLVAGRAHLKHTEGGDFRQATYRAIRQGLMKAREQGTAELLEPYYEFTLEVQRSNIGRAMNDIDRRAGRITGQFETESGEDMVLLTGRAPVSTMQGYVRDVIAYTGGLGSLYCSFCGYYPCHNSSEVMEKSGYEPLSDMRNPSYSVFCAHGAGFPVEWDEVDSYKHIDCRIDFRQRAAENGNKGGKTEKTGFSASKPGGGWSISGKYLTKGSDDEADYEDLMNRDIPEAGSSTSDTAGRTQNVSGNGKFSYVDESVVTLDEIASIMSRTFYANKKDSYKNPFRKHRLLESRRRQADTLVSASGKNNDKAASGQEGPERKHAVQKDKYLLVDGYNIIFAWEELRELAEVNVDGARDRLNDILCNYQAMHDYNLIVVYDAYRIQGHTTEHFAYRNINVVYTREAEIADRFIERFVHDNAAKYDITVATSDGLEQIIIRGQGAKLFSARDMYDEVKRNEENIRSNYLEKGMPERTGTQMGERMPKI